MAVVSTFVFTSDTETVTRTKLNNLVANLLTEFNGSIDNANIKPAAGIVASKLILTSPGAIGSVAANSGAFTTLTASGATTLNGAVTLGDGADLLTINSSSGITYTPAATWTFSADQTVSGTWADLGIITTADINGGTLDGVQVGGTTATGEILVNDSSDAANGLGDQGTSGQILTSAGAGSNPTWENAVNTSNVLFSYTGYYLNLDSTGPDFTGEVTGATSVTDSSTAPGFRYIFHESNSTVQVLSWKFVKIQGISTVTVQTFATAEASTGTPTVAVDIGGQSGSVGITEDSTPTWFSFTIDVSSLTNGVVYDVSCTLTNGQAGGSNAIFLYNVMGFGS